MILWVVLLLLSRPPEPPPCHPQPHDPMIEYDPRGYTVLCK